MRLLFNAHKKNDFFERDRQKIPGGPQDCTALMTERDLGEQGCAPINRLAVSRPKRAGVSLTAQAAQETISASSDRQGVASGGWGARRAAYRRVDEALHCRRRRPGPHRPAARKQIPGLSSPGVGVDNTVGPSGWARIYFVERVG